MNKPSIATKEDKQRRENVLKLLKTSPKNVAITTKVCEWQFEISKSKLDYMKLKAEHRSKIKTQTENKPQISND